ncbi:DUF3592 domain-containing protein [Corallincola platygyrae]|uniref:DUF3592 domain-containing protein n=1 Tax=Corallincola platygyrae TaxID=1193278 RepID=A0ABW4XI06_9GAMM
MTLTDYLENMWKLAMQGELQGIWFWAAVYCLLVCSYSIVFQLRTRRWPSVKGKLIEVGLSKFGADSVRAEQDYIAEALYSYTVDDVSYTGSKVSPWIFVTSHNARFILQKQMRAIQTYPDGGVKVFYNPRNPKKSLLIVAGKVGLVVTLLIATLPMILYYSRFYG